MHCSTIYATQNIHLKPGHILILQFVFKPHLIFFSQPLTRLRIQLRYLAPCTQVILLAVGGDIGAGKSTLSAAVAPHLGTVPGAIILRSDVLRKTLAKCDMLSRAPVTAYAPEATVAVYTALATEAASILRQGSSVVADATFTSTATKVAITEVTPAISTLRSSDCIAIRFDSVHVKQGLYLWAFGCMSTGPSGASGSSAGPTTRPTLMRPSSMRLCCLGCLPLATNGKPFNTEWATGMNDRPLCWKDGTCWRPTQEALSCSCKRC
jgi:hypothetical protein